MESSIEESQPIFKRRGRDTGRKEQREKLEARDDGSDDKVEGREPAW